MSQAEIDVLAELRERIGGTKIAVVFTKREATALIDRIEELEAAVAPFAAFADGIDHFNGWSRPGTYAYESSIVGSRSITEDDFRRARKALSGEKQ